MLQQAARQRTDSHNIHRMKDLPVSTILQDVAVKGSNVAGEHAPEHALNLGVVPRQNAIRRRKWAWFTGSAEVLAIAFRPGIGSSVTADENEMMRRVEYRDSGRTSPAGHPPF